MTRLARITPEPMRAALEWSARYRRLWESELEQLARDLENAAESDAFPPNPGGPMATNTGPAVDNIPTLQVRRTIRAPQQRVYDA